MTCSSQYITLTSIAMGVVGGSAVDGARRMASFIHRMLCKKGTCEKAARPVSEPSFSVSRTLVGAWFTDTTFALSSACSQLANF